jgi:hypothetical protein
MRAWRRRRHYSILSATQEFTSKRTKHSPNKERKRKAEVGKVEEKESKKVKREAFVLVVNISDLFKPNLELIRLLRLSYTLIDSKLYLKAPDLPSVRVSAWNYGMCRHYLYKLSSLL